MHLSDALLSPTVGITLWLVSGGALVAASRRLRQRADDRLVPLMGVLGATVFAAQMINFSIPATGSSGHLGGGLLLAILLGAPAAFVVIASVLTVQALLFADGGLLALGANLFNLGLVPCFVVYPLVYRPLAGAAPAPWRQALATGVAAWVAVQLGALGVVLQTGLSGIVSLPLATFALLMLGIHAAIGVVEGLATIAILRFVAAAQPDLLVRPDTASRETQRSDSRTIRRLLARLAGMALLCGGVLSWFGSPLPDGLAWSAAQAAGIEQPAAPLAPPQDLHRRLADLQQWLAWLPDYKLPASAGTPPVDPATPEPWPAIKPATSLSGVIGGAVTLGLVIGVGWLLRRRRRPTA